MLSIIYNIYTQFHCIVCAISKIREQNKMDIVVFDDVNMIRMYFGVTLFVDFTGFDILHAQFYCFLFNAKSFYFSLARIYHQTKNELLWGCYSATWENDLILMATTVQARKFSFSCLILNAWGYQIQRYFFSLILL